LAPQPEQVPPVVSTFVPQTSHVPAAVPQPAAPLHVTVQHWFPLPTAQAVCVAVHVQVLHVSAVPEQ
jgi:hypothetical protein